MMLVVDDEVAYISDGAYTLTACVFGNEDEALLVAQVEYSRRTYLWSIFVGVALVLLVGRMTIRR